MESQTSTQQQCRGCKQPAAENKQECVYHIIQHLIRRAIQGTGLKVSTARRQRIGHKLYQMYLANPYCPLTGEILGIGHNAHLDHIIPKSKNPKLALTLSNLRWVHRRVNVLKGDISDEHLIDIARKIVRTADASNKTVSSNIDMANADSQGKGTAKRNRSHT